MIYINSVTKIANFPRNSKKDASILLLTNQLDKSDVSISVVNTSTNNTRYVFDLSSLNISDGQYDYYIKDGDNNIVESGILQSGNYTPTTIGYSSEINIIQYGG